MREIDLIVVHCSATPPSMDIGAAEIRKWHTDPKPVGRGWSDIGYQSVIRRNGVLEHGRDMRRIGAHVHGYNTNSIGICVVGGINESGDPENNFEPPQMATLRAYLQTLLEIFPNAQLLGHRDLSPDLNHDGVIEENEWMKACPSFDVREWYYSELQGHVSTD